VLDVVCHNRIVNLVDIRRRIERAINLWQLTKTCQLTLRSTAQFCAIAFREFFAVFAGASWKLGRNRCVWEPVTHNGETIFWWDIASPRENTWGA
jgi:hypothetical protein